DCARPLLCHQDLLCVFFGSPRRKLVQGPLVEPNGMVRVGRGTFGRASSGVTGGLGTGAFGDFDNDGHVDLFLAGANALYRGNGKASFTRTNIDFGAVNSYCASWADFDNDSFLDLFAGNYYTGGLNTLLQNNGNGGFTKLTTTPPGRDRSNSQGVTWADY